MKLKNVTVAILIMMVLYNARGCFEGSVESGEEPVVMTGSNLITETFLHHQIEYTEKNQIKLEGFSEQGKVADWVQGALEDLRIGKNLVEVKSAGVFSERYERTLYDGEYYYLGEMKDNRPHGYGMLLKRDWFLSQNREDLDCGMEYIGEFIDGQYNGYGLLFNDTESVYNSTKNAVLAAVPDTTGEDFLDLYYGAVNYVIYEGEFKNGEQTGKGNCFLTYDDNMTDGIQYPVVAVGGVKDGELHGDVRIYNNGRLSYSGGMKKGEMDGQGTEYYMNGQVCYEGSFKDDEYHGEGALYDESGTLVYKGKWRYGDIG